MNTELWALFSFISDLQQELLSRQGAKIFMCPCTLGQSDERKHVPLAENKGHSPAESFRKSGHVGARFGQGKLDGRKVSGKDSEITNLHYLTTS